MVRSPRSPSPSDQTIGDFEVGRCARERHAVGFRALSYVGGDRSPDKEMTVVISLSAFWSRARAELVWRGQRAS